MDNEAQKRLDLLFEMENIKTPLMNYIAPGVNLKIVAELGSKDKNGNKRRFYEETRYYSEKYKNTDHLVSASFRVNTNLALEYPNPNYDERDPRSLRSKVIYIRPYNIYNIVNAMRELSMDLNTCYRIKGGKMVLLSDKVKSVKVYPSFQESIIFSNDIFDNVNQNRQEVGIRITLNDEYSFVVSGETTWPELLYKLSTCDLTMIGIQMIQSYMALLPGMATSDIGKGSYNGSSRYRPYWGEDPDDIVNNPDSVQVHGRPITKKDKINKFFDNI